MIELRISLVDVSELFSLWISWYILFIYWLFMLIYQGISFSSLMYVTKKNMANAVESMTKQLDQVSAALAVSCSLAYCPFVMDIFIFWNLLQKVMVVVINPCNKVIQFEIFSLCIFFFYLKPFL